jgi:hypothetical protein
VGMWIHFNLGEIPRDRWMKGFQIDDAGRKEFSSKAYSESTDAYPTIDHFGDGNFSRGIHS